MSKKHRKWLTLLGKFQNIPLLERDINIIRRFLKQSKNILIMLRKEDGTDKNPYTQKERFDAFCKVFPEETKTGKIILSSVPDINEIKIMNET